MADEARSKRRRFRPVHLLLAIPFIAELWVPFYNLREPTLAGVPFFYWYQLLWIVVAAVLLAIVYRTETQSGD
jgi:hypothetical protein